MTTHQTDRARRDFLLSSGVFAAAGLLGSGARTWAETTTDDGSQTRPAASPGASNLPRITRDSFVEAEKFAGIEFTEAEREMMARSIGEQLAIAKARLQMPFPANAVAPATIFTPRLPGMRVNREEHPFVRTEVDPGPLPAHDDDIAFAPVTHLSRWIERRQLTSRRLTEIYIERLKRFDPRLKCVITLTEDLARRQSRRADDEIAAGNYRGPLHGIPWGAKDLLDTVGVPTTWGAEPYRDRVPKRDAAVVKRLEEAGAVLVAKLSLGALAYNDIWFGGRTNNPWNVKDGSSGSSAGSAAATAAGLVGFAIGTETYGSITSPCLRCGVTGLRPTFGRVARTGAMALCWSLDKIGPICRTVEDCALVLRAINGGDAGDPASISVPFNFDASAPFLGLRFGFHPDWFKAPEGTSIDSEALEAMKRLHMESARVDLPKWPYESLLSVLTCEAAAAFEELTRTGLDDELKWQEDDAWPNTFRKTWFVPGVQMVQADRFRRQVMEMMDRQFKRVDVIIAPCFGASLCLITNFTGHPSLTLRCGFRKDGTPHAITLIGRLYDEGTLCAVGMALERELNVWRARPRLDE